jgi:hypothetical protein
MVCRILSGSGARACTNRVVRQVSCDVGALARRGRHRRPRPLRRALPVCSAYRRTTPNQSPIDIRGAGRSSYPLAGLSPTDRTMCKRETLSGTQGTHGHLDEPTQRQNVRVLPPSTQVTRPKPRCAPRGSTTWSTSDRGRRRDVGPGIGLSSGIDQTGVTAASDMSHLPLNRPPRRRGQFHACRPRQRRRRSGPALDVATLSLHRPPRLGSASGRAC